MVQRRFLLALVSLMALGSLAAHGLAYLSAAPDAGRRAQLLAETGHDYFAALPAVVGITVAVLALVVVAQLFSPRTGRISTRARWLLLVVPPLGYALQEHLERFAESGAFPVDAALEPTFLLGLLLQIPFGLAAVALARGLLAVAARVASRLRHPPVPAAARAAARGALFAEAERPALDVLASGHSGRAPPVTAG